jgi:extradiol dioxygenase family protein
MRLTPFHVALQVRDINEARNFYKTILGCSEGRSDAQWIDFNLYGHQLVCHLNPSLGPQGKISAHHNSVDAHSVPVPHCGVVLEMGRLDCAVTTAQGTPNTIRRRALCSLRGTAGRASDAIFPGSIGKCARV